MKFDIKPEHMTPELQAVLDENERVSRLPIKAHYFGATVGSTTARDGVVIDNGRTEELVDGVSVARTGDIVGYPDGSQATIVSGAGFAASYSNGTSMALVGSHLSNGDIIIKSPVMAIGFTIYAGEPAIEGFLDVNYLPRA